VKPGIFPLLIIIFALLSAGCTVKPPLVLTSARPKPLILHVFAATSLTEPFGEIRELFEVRQPGVTVGFNFAGSQQLAQQIIAGAPVDVFASANRQQMDTIIESGAVISGTQQSIAKNRLVVIFPKENPAELTVLQDLAKPNLKLVLAAQEVPVGQYTLDFLDKAAANSEFKPTFKDDVLGNVVSYENNVKAVFTKVALGEADAGIVYVSDISGTDAMVGIVDIPDPLNIIALYSIASVKESKSTELVQAFIDLVLSREGQDILAKYNFIPVK
jgi:molybdate transport system substrate-binding protein